MDEIKNSIERLFERLLWKSRMVTLLPVIFGLLGAFVMFIVASYDIIKVIIYAWNYLVVSDHSIDLHSDSVGLIIGAIDLYLMALVFLYQSRKGFRCRMRYGRVSFLSVGPMLRRSLLRHRHG